MGFYVGLCEGYGFIDACLCSFGIKICDADEAFLAECVIGLELGTFSVTEQVGGSICMALFGDTFWVGIG
jgi:hypothetical protein